MAFKVKTTAPKIYCVRPNAAVIGPKEQVQIQVILLGLAEEPGANFKCKDKFLLIALPAPYDLGGTPVPEAWSQLEAEFKEQAVSKKIKVRYLLGEDANRTAKNAEGGARKLSTAAMNSHALRETAPASAPKFVSNVSHDTLDSRSNLLKPSSVASNTVKDRVEEAGNVAFTAGPQKSDSSQKKSSTLSQNQEGSSAFSPAFLLAFALLALVFGWLYY